MQDLILDIVDREDDIEPLTEAMLSGFDVVPVPSGVAPYKATPLAIALRGRGGNVEGGVIGHSAWDWLYVKLLWVAEEHRGSGYGKRLLDAAEDVARDRGCLGVWLNTQSFQAPAFYERQGYERFGEIADFPKDHKRIFYQKRLQPR